ncbi:GAP family protein [Luteimicrobium subarcticum]|uniref:Sap-like sulfolipid-1-addressing protein n=1 Tax=Luteimicrobium subarcticum TaxID=620910 RepID=A0A2M8WJM5_9MICO|nr:GAP family protein [Luteimicrobium subarcticum]PJI91131.1 Sap-like sulfolipid-1-addressing protein [Luteimicrobium subarcticum]
MNGAIGASLPVAVGVMISPLPIAAVVLMLSSAKAKVNAFAFLVGWVLAVFVIALVVAMLAGSSTDDDGGPAAWVSWTKIVLGVLVLFLCFTQWQGRPREGQQASPPKWMSAIDSFTPVKATGLAVLLGGINPKNLLLVISGGATIAAAAPDDTTAQVVASIVFAVVASLGVLLPIVIYLAMGDRAPSVLDAMKNWLVQHNNIVLAVLLLVIGVKLLGDGIAGL